MSIGEAAREDVARLQHKPAARARTVVTDHGEHFPLPSTPKLAITLQIIAALCWLPQAALLAFAVGGIGTGAPASAALLPALGIFIFGAARAAIDRAGVRIAHQRARENLSRLRAKVARATSRRTPLDIGRPSSGELASILGEQSEAIIAYYARFHPLRAKAMIVPLVILACVLPLSWVTALVLVMAAPVIPIFMALIGWQAKATSEAQLARMGDMNAFLLDRLRGLTTIRAFGAIDATAQRLREEAEALRKSTMAVLRIAFLSSAVLELFAALGVALVAVYVGFHYLGELRFGAWGGKLSLSQGLFILLLAPAFFEPLRDLSTVWHDRAAGEAALDALDRLSADAPKIVGAAQTARDAVSPGPLSVQVDGLRYAYPGSQSAIFDCFDLAVTPGEKIALWAPSGGGKSTLLALLAGLAQPNAGTIRLGGVPLNEQSAAHLRTSIAWLGQPPHIFSGTLAGNITLGRADARANLPHAIRVAHLDQLVAVRGPAQIGENSIGLSGGEALRLALARMAAGSRPGLILADEPTAHLDRETANEIIDRLLAIADDATLIVATHDPVLAQRMDRIVTLDEGRIGR